MRNLSLGITSPLLLALLQGACGEETSKTTSDASPEVSDTSTDVAIGDDGSDVDDASDGGNATDPLPIEPFAASGTRLRAVFAKVDELSMFNGFWDEELQARCRFSPVDNGTLRCLPEAAFLLYFADENCTEIWLNRPDSCGDEPKHFVNFIQEGLCSGNVTEVWSVTPSEAPASGALYRRDPTGCKAVSSDAPLPTGGWYRPGTKVELDSFVSASREYGSAGGEPGVSILQGSDGSRVVENLALPSGETCVPRRASPSNESRCMPFSDVMLELPSQTGNYAWFGDNECKILLAYAPRSGRTCPGAELPKYANVLDFDPAPAPPRPFFGLSMVTGILGPEAPVWQRLTPGGPCVETVASESIFELYTVGDPIPVETFPLVNTTTLGDDIKIEVTVDNAGNPLSGGIFGVGMSLLLGSGGSCLTFSTKDGIVCIESDKQIRPPFGENDFFSDSACAEPLLSFGNPGEVIYIQAGNSCPEISEAWKVSEARELTEVFTMNGGQCSAVSQPEQTTFFTIEKTDIGGIPVTLETSPAMP